jgi:high affinity Mn2+ porin
MKGVGGIGQLQIRALNEAVLLADSRTRTPNAARLVQFIAGMALLMFGVGWSQAKAEDGEAHFNVHAQTTFIEQRNLPFRALYEGENSLKSRGEWRESWTVTPSLGLRLWSGGEFYVNPETFQGFGLASTHGLGGFANGEAQKGGSDIPEPYIARVFVRQTFGFGGEKETFEDQFNQLPGKKDVSRLTVTIGKLSVSDIFDENKFASDPRNNFWNWAMWESGAFDYAADQKGYTWGMALDFNQKSWALRGGYFLVPIFSNAQSLDHALLRRGQYVGEFEMRYTLGSQPGTVKLLGWFSRAYAGSYQAAVADPAVDPNTAIEDSRHTRTKYGYAVSLEQALSKELGTFARLSWADGQSEIMSFTDIDASVAIGLSLKGKSWGRPNDTVGLAGAVNALSSAHKDFIAAGGLGVLIGDGKLTYAHERILETYYSLCLRKQTFVTFDYQLAANPGYNSDRGPVSIFGTRFHADF